MKRLIAAAVLSAATLAAVAASLTETFDAEAARLNAQADAGQLTELRHAQAMAQLARDLFPRDAALIELRDFKVGLAGRMERGEITRAQYDTLWNARNDAFQSERTATQNQAAAVASSQKGVAGAVALGVAADSLNRSRASSPRNCQTMGVGASLQTTCY